MTIPIRCTKHAARRLAQRNLSDLDVRFVLEHGRRVRCAGALHIFLGCRDIPSDKVTYKRFAHLEGTVLVIHATLEAVVLLTAYRNRRGLKDVRRKPKYVNSAALDKGHLYHQ